MTVSRVLAKVVRLALGTLGVLMAVAALLLGLAWGYARSEAGRRQLVGLLNAEGQRFVPGLQVGHLGGDLLHHVILEDVTVRDREGRAAIHVDRLTATYRLASLWRKKIDVTSLLVERPTVEARQSPSGSWNLAELGGSPPSSSPSPPKEGQAPGFPVAVELHDLTVRQLRAMVFPREGPEVTVKDLSLNARGGMAGPASHVEIESLWFEVNRDDLGVTVDLRARMGLDDKSVFAVLEGATIHGLPTGWVRLNGQGGGARSDPGMVLSVATESQGHVSLRGDAHLADGALERYRWSVDADELRPRDWEARAPNGVFSLQAQGGGTGIPLASGSSAHADVTVPRVFAATLSTQGPALRAQLRAELASWLRPWLPPGTAVGTLQVEAQARGQWPGEVVGAVHLVAKNLEKEGLRLRDADLRATARMAPHKAPAGDLVLQALGLRNREKTVLSRATVRVHSDGHTLDVRGDVHAPTGEGRLRARGPLSPQRLEARLEEATWTSAQGSTPPSASTSAAASARTHQTVALARTALLTWSRTAGVSVKDLNVRAKGFPLDGDLLLDGQYAPATNGRGASGRVRLAVKKVAWQGSSPLDLELSAELLGPHLRAQADVHPGGPAVLHVDADLPMENTPRHALALARSGNLEGHLKTHEGDVRNIPLLQKALARRGLVGGVVELDITVSGEVQHPDARGLLSLRDIEVRSLAGRGRESVLRRLRGLGARIALDTGPGMVRAQGAISLERNSMLEFTASLARDPGVLLRTRDWSQVPYQGTLNVPSLDLAIARSLDDRFNDVTGVVTAHAEVQGRGKSFTGQGALAVQGARIGKVGFSAVSLQAAASPTRASLDALITQAPSGALTAHAELDRTQNALQGKMQVKQWDPGVVRLFAPQLRELSGVVDGLLTLTGSPAAPVVAGTVDFYRGRVGLIGQPTFTGVGAEVTFSPDKIALRKFGAYSGDGSLQGQGWLTLRGGVPQHLVATAQAHGFVVAAAGASGAKIDGDLAVEAVMRSSILQGEARIPEARVWLPQVVGSSRSVQKIGTREDVHFVDEAGKAAEARATAPSETKSFGLELRAVAGTVYVRGKDLDLELESHVHVERSPEDSVVHVSGNVEIRRGHIMLTGQRFEIDRGSMVFHDTGEPQMDVRISHAYPDATVAVELRGTPSHPQLRLVSDPAIYDSSQIISLVLTGQAGGAPSSGSSDPTAALGTAVLGKIADKVAPEVGLDVVRVENVKETTPDGAATGSTDTRVEVGKYIGSRVYLSYAHVFGAALGQNTNQAQVEYRATRRWLVETVFGDAGVGGVDALWTFRY